MKHAHHKLQSKLSYYSMDNSVDLKLGTWTIIQHATLVYPHGCKMVPCHPCSHCSDVAAWINSSLSLLHPVSWGLTAVCKTLDRAPLFAIAPLLVCTFHFWMQIMFLPSFLCYQATSYYPTHCGALFHSSFIPNMVSRHSWKRDHWQNKLAGLNLRSRTGWNTPSGMASAYHPGFCSLFIQHIYWQSNLH